MPYLVSLEVNYADEFNVKCATVFTDEHWKYFKQLLEEFPTNDYEFYFGTNEAILFDLNKNTFRYLYLSNIEADVINDVSHIYNSNLFSQIIEYFADQIYDKYGEESDESEKIIDFMSTW